MNNIDPGEGSVDVLAILQEQLESRNKTTVVVESTVLIILISLPWLVMLSCVLSLTAIPSFVRLQPCWLWHWHCMLTTATVMPLTIDAVINSRRRFSETRQTWAKSHISKYWEFFNSFFVQDNFACFIEWLNSALVKTDQRKSSSAQIGCINQQSLWIEIIDYWKLMLTGKSVFSEKHFQY